VEGDAEGTKETQVGIHRARPGTVRHGWVWKRWKNPKTNQWERTFAVITGDPNELIAPIHNRMITFLQPRDHAEYPETADRPPVHLLRILPAESKHATLIEELPTTNRQVRLIDSQ
jgi:putative SOS response-associated peptidase YedK